MKHFRTNMEAPGSTLAWLLGTMGTAAVFFGTGHLLTNAVAKSKRPAVGIGVVIAGVLLIGLAGRHASTES